MNRLTASRTLKPQLIAGLLEKQLLTSQSKLPGVRKLCRTHNVSPVTMLKALHLLENQGIIKIKQGAGCFPPHCLSQKPSSSSVRNLINEVRTAILKGDIRSGQALPKIDHLCRSHAVSSATVCEALRQLNSEKLIHKLGRRWIIGSEDQHLSRNSVADSRRHTVIILLPRIDHWEHFCTHPGLSSFTHELLSQFDAHRFRHRIAFEKGEMSGAIHLCGREAILKQAQELGERLRGVLIFGEYTDFSDLDQWVTFAHPFRVPVVWFDYNCRRMDYDRRRFPRIRYYRLHPNETEAVALALGALHNAGHRNIGVPECSRFQSDGWQSRRINLIESIAGTLRPPTSVTIRLQSECWWPDRIDFSDEAMPAFCSGYEEIRFEKPHDEEGGLIRFRDRLAAAIPSLSSLARSVTALITPNDVLGANYYYYLSKTGVDIPQKLSMISFDNRMSLHHYPLSTIDFGFGDLGYRAAQLFIGDIPGSADSRGNMASRPRLLDRGSIAPPRQR